MTNIQNNNEVVNIGGTFSKVKDGTGRWLVSGHAYGRIKERFGYEGEQADRFAQHIMVEADMSTKRASDQTDGVFEVWNNIRGIKIVYNENQNKIVTVIDELQGSEIDDNALDITSTRREMNRKLKEVTREMVESLVETRKEFEKDMYNKMSDVYRLKAERVMTDDDERIAHICEQVDQLGEEIQNLLELIGEVKTRINLIENSIII